MAEQILRMPEVFKATGLSKSSLNRRVKDDDFPPPVRLGAAGSRAVGWWRSEVDDWAASRPRSTEFG